MANMTPTNSFIQTLTKTPQEAGELSGNFSRLKNSNDEIVTVLGYPQTVSNDLNKLYDTLKLTSDLLSVVDVIPEVGEAAEGLQSSIKVLMEEVEPAKNAASKIAAKTTPLHNNLKKLDPIFDKAILVANQVQAKSSSFLTTFNQIVGCVNSLPDGQPKTTSENYLNQFSVKAEPGDSYLNQAMTAANNAINGFYNELNAIKDALNPLSEIMSGIKSVLSVLKPIISLLSELKNDLMSIKIPIPIPYPHMVSLYDIFKTLGDFISLAMKPIQSLVNEILKALHITLPSIPGLDQLLHININIPSIPNFDSLIDVVEKYYNELKAVLALFNLNCPPNKGQKDFITQTSIKA
ncbi:hypothetical protein [Tenacibaculum sp. nBUS_03]|uniref:hypothetical protein n=1 Tax=Tenacibaculum sp. nBUS_03 TaxID=3395320 RepID=UPI003EBD5AB8